MLTMKTDFMMFNKPVPFEFYIHCINVLTELLYLIHMLLVF